MKKWGQRRIIYLLELEINNTSLTPFFWPRFLYYISRCTPEGLGLEYGFICCVEEECELPSFSPEMASPKI